MNLSRSFVRRPVATSLLMIAIVLAGLLAVRFLPVSSLPDVDYPTIQIQTFYPGASAQVMANTVTAPLEVQLGQIAGLAQMTSASSAGASMITLQFDLSLDLDVAEQRVQQAINAAGSLLPAGLPAPPTYAKVNPAAQSILTLALTSDTLPLTSLQDLAGNRLGAKLSQVAGVGLVAAAGGNVPAVRITADPKRLAGYGLNLDDLRTLIGNISVSAPKGSFDGPQLNYTIDANDQIRDPAQYLDTVIAWQNGAAVRLRDVANVQEAPQNTELGAWVGHQAAIVLSVQRQPGANVIATVERIRAQLPTLLASLPPSMKVQVIGDGTGMIRASVGDATFELGLSVALVVLVIWAFLRSVPATVIPAISLPVSLIGTLAAMYLLHYSIDNLSLMALIIATGFVVDDSVVMIENIVRYVEQGVPPLQAAIQGAGQIGFTIVSLTLSLIAVLIPLLFMGGVIGRLFSEFAVTLSVTVLLSAVVSLTLVPMLCARALRAGSVGDHGRDGRLGLFLRVRNGYARVLDFVLRHEVVTLLLTMATVAVTVALYVLIPKGLFPVQDTGVIQGISVADSAVSYAAMTAHQQALADALLTDPDVADVTSIVGIDGVNPTLNSGRFTIRLRESRTASAATIARRLADASASVPGIRLSLRPVQDLTLDTSPSAQQYRLVLRGPNQQAFASVVPPLLQRMRALKAVTNVSSDLDKTGPGVTINVNRPLAASMGITAATIDNMLYDALGQRIVSTVFTQSAQYRVILAVDPGSVPTVASLGALTVPSQVGSGGQVRLDAIADISMTRVPLVISRLAQFPAVTIGFDVRPGASLSTAVGGIQRAVSDMQLPPSITASFGGAAQAYQDSLGSEVFLVVAAIAVVYIVLGVLYESFIHPVTILSTLPSAGIGALLALWLAGLELDIIGIIGIVLLIGIVKKNAILIVDFALEAQREHGRSAREAVIEAALLRLRPILMTTFAAMLGALPMVIGSVAGAELRRPLGLAIVGGLAMSQILTLLTTPVIYLALDRAAGWWRAHAPGRRDAQASPGDAR